MTEQKLTFEDLATHAIVEGFQSGIQMFMEDLEHTLRNDVLIQEAGDVDSIIGATIEEMTTPKFEELESKLASVLG